MNIIILANTIERKLEVRVCYIRVLIMNVEK